MRAARTWTPVADAALRARARAQASSIADALRSSGPGELSFDLGAGCAGVARFFADLHALEPEHGHDAQVELFVDRAIEALSERVVPPGLLDGYLGVAFVTQQLWGATMDSDDANEAIDAALLSLLDADTWRGPYDLVSGLVGFGVYALERGPREAAVRSRRGVLAALVARAVRRDGQASWQTPAALLPRARRGARPDGTHDLGMAHGAAGVIALLAAMLEHPEGAGAAPLLEEACAWLLAHGVSSEGDGYAAEVLPGVVTRGARTAWCYGDLGIAASLSLAARALDSRQLAAEALRAAHRAAARSLASTGVVDASFCHGAAGLAHIFGRLHQLHDDAELERARRHWLEHTLALARPGEGIGGYRTLQPGGGWSDERGLLEGAAGVGLVLLAASSEQPPSWDRALQLSLRADEEER